MFPFFTSLQSILGSDTFLSMKKLLEQEEENERRKAELEGKLRVEQSKALPQLLRDFEDQVERKLYEQDDQVSLSSTEVEQQLPDQGLCSPQRQSGKEFSPCGSRVLECWVWISA